MGVRSLLEDTVDRIRNDILKRHILPGERLNVDGLARAFGTSKTPVREALNGLVSERLVLYRPRLGYYVQKLSVSEFVETSETQQAIEQYILLKLARNAVALDFDKLTSINRKIVLAIDEENPIRIFELNKAFHLEMYKRCGNKKMIFELKRIWNELLIHRYNMFASNAFLSCIVDDHIAIMDAMRTRDLQAILSALDRHFENGVSGASENCGVPKRPIAQ